MEFLIAAFMGLIEGITEFIPVSSTGHLIVAGHLLLLQGPSASTFEVFIQLGAILAVVVVYRKKFLQLASFKREAGFKGLNGLVLLALTTLPALAAGALAHGFIKRHLFNPATVAVGLGVGGIAILLVEKLMRGPKRFGLDNLTWKDALLIGLFQCLALWPGTSRSACTILGAMLLGVDRKTAAEYSFFAAVPVMCAAVSFDLYKSAPLLSPSDMGVFAVGFAAAFLFALLAIKFFIRLLGKHTLIPFGWYRIAMSCFVFWAL